MLQYYTPIKIQKQNLEITFIDTIFTKGEFLTLEALFFVGENKFTVYPLENGTYKIDVYKKRLETNQEKDHRVQKEILYMQNYEKFHDFRKNVLHQSNGPLE